MQWTREVLQLSLHSQEMLTKSNTAIYLIILKVFLLLLKFSGILANCNCKIILCAFHFRCFWKTFFPDRNKEADAHNHTIKNLSIETLHINCLALTTNQCLTDCMVCSIKQYAGKSCKFYDHPLILKWCLLLHNRRAIFY